MSSFGDDLPESRPLTRKGCGLYIRGPLMIHCEGSGLLEVNLRGYLSRTHSCSPPGSLANIPLTPETQRDQERRIRREIANSNERRRMQSINAGFQSLKTLIPHTDGEKLSKVGRSREGFPEEVSHSHRERTISPTLSLLPSGSHSPADSRIHLLS